MVEIYLLIEFSLYRLQKLQCFQYYSRLNSFCFVTKYLCTYQYQLYKCNQAITTPEASFVPAHWDLVNITSQLHNIDNTLTIQGDAADSKAVGDAVGELKTQIDDVNSALSEAVTMGEWNEIILVPGTPGYYDLSGVFHEEANRQNATVDAEPGDKFSLNTKIKSNLIPAVEFFSGTSFESYLKAGTGTSEVLEDYTFMVPAGVNKVIVQSAVGPQDYTMSLKKFDATNTFKAYTKEESDAKYYSKTNGEELDERTDVIEDDIYTNVSSWENLTLTVQTDGYYNTSGAFTSEAGRRYAVIDNIQEGEQYKLSTWIRSTLIPAVVFFNGETFSLYLKAGTGTSEYVTDYEFTIPTNATKMVVQNASSSAGEFAVKKHTTTKEPIFYTKQEVDAKVANTLKKYGVKWDIDDSDDLGQRCFDAVGLSATIGIGNTNGASDYDSIYPWSEMKRCNIAVNANGAKIVTYEGETGFALDGTNGDVFVRIPKFYYERYQADGYEYRVISAIGTNPHPAFVENGVELDEIFVGAFEGTIVSDTLRSKGGAIPTSNETAQTFLTAAESNGDGYTLYDMRTVDCIWNLMAVEYGCRNTNQIIGYGYADYLQATNDQWGVPCDAEATSTNIFSAAKSIPEARINYMPVGSTVVICQETQSNCIAFRKLTAKYSDASHWYLTFDGDAIDLNTTCFIGSAGCITNFCETVPTGALSWHTGRANWISGSTTKNPVRYRWIENIVGSLWHFLPDITFNDLQMFTCSDISKYEIGATANGYKAVGAVMTAQTSNGNKSDIANSNYWINELSMIPFAKGVSFGKTWDMSLTSVKAFGAYYYLGSGKRLIANGGGFDHLYRCNMLTNRAWIFTTDKWYLYGARLLYKNV